MIFELWVRMVFQLHKQLNLGTYKTAWLLLNKLRRAMVNPDRKKLSDIVEVDEPISRTGPSMTLMSIAAACVSSARAISTADLSKKSGASGWKWVRASRARSRS